MFVNYFIEFFSIIFADMCGHTIPYDIQNFISVIYGKIAFTQYIGKCLSGNTHLVCNPAFFVTGFINGSIYGFYQTFTVIYYIITPSFYLPNEYWTTSVSGVCRALAAHCLPSLELYLYYHIRMYLSTILLNFFQIFLLTSYLYICATNRANKSIFRRLPGQF